MGVPRRNALEIAVAGVLRLQTAFVTDTGLQQPLLCKQPPPSKLRPFPEEQVLPPAVVHSPSRLDFEFGLVGAIVGAFVLHAGTQRGTETVAPREIQNRGQGNKCRLGLSENRHRGDCKEARQGAGDDMANEIHDGESSLVITMRIQSVLTRAALAPGRHRL